MAGTVRGDHPGDCSTKRDNESLVRVTFRLSGSRRGFAVKAPKERRMLTAVDGIAGGSGAKLFDGDVTSSMRELPNPRRYQWRPPCRHQSGRRVCEIKSLISQRFWGAQAETAEPSEVVLGTRANSIRRVPTWGAPLRWSGLIRIGSSGKLPCGATAAPSDPKEALRATSQPALRSSRAERVAADLEHEILSAACRSGLTWVAVRRSWTGSASARR